jgi:hypothetical protein
VKLIPPSPEEAKRLAQKTQEAKNAIQ